MSFRGISHKGAWWLAGSVIIVAWGAVGLYQGLHSGFSGGLYDIEYRVPGVPPGGVADRAGLKRGDRVISVEGRPVEELGMESRWPRWLAPRAGESRRFVVERNGERIPIDVTFPPPFPAAVNNRIRAALTGLSWLVIGVWTFLAVRTPPARTLGYIGLTAGVGVSLGLGPQVSVWPGVLGHLATAADTLMFILLLRFFVTFPAVKRVSRSRVAAWLIYGAWGCLIVFLAVELGVHPALYYTTGNVAGPLILAYAALTLTAVIHTLAKGPRRLVRESGMIGIVAGILIGTAGTALSFVLPTSLPPWTGAIWLAAIPLSMALAVGKQARLEAAGGEGDR